MVNDPNFDSVQGRVYFPRARFFYNPDGGLQNPTAEATTEIPCLLQIHVNRNRFFTSDRFKAVFALFGDPNFSYTFWGQLQSMSVRIEMAFDEATVGGARTVFRDWTSVFHGIADKIEQNVVKGTVTVTGRSLDAVYNDNHAIYSFNEATAKQVIEDLAAKYGFTPVVDDGLDVTFGREQNDEKTHQTLGIMSRQVNEKDIIQYLCTHFGAVFYMQDTELHAHINPEAEQWIINAPTPDFLGNVAKHKPSNFTNLIFEHNLVYSSQAHQIVATWINPGKKEGGTIKSPQDADVPEGVQQHQMTIEATSQEDAQTKADNAYVDYIGREWTLEWETSNPELIDIKPTDRLFVQGTNSTNDGLYALDSWEFYLDSKSGFRAVIHGAVGKILG